MAPTIPARTSPVPAVAKDGGAFVLISVLAFTAAKAQLWVVLGPLPQPDDAATYTRVFQTFSKALQIFERHKQSARINHRGIKAKYGYFFRRHISLSCLHQNVQASDPDYADSIDSFSCRP